MSMRFVRFKHKTSVKINQFFVKIQLELHNIHKISQYLKEPQNTPLFFCENCQFYNFPKWSPFYKAIKKLPKNYVADLVRSIISRAHKKQRFMLFMVIDFFRCCFESITHKALRLTNACNIWNANKFVLINFLGAWKWRIFDGRNWFISGIDGNIRGIGRVQNSGWF